MGIQLAGWAALVLIEAALILALSTAAFDALHYLLHRGRGSRFALLRWAAGLHQVHHEFLPPDMQVKASLRWRNVVAHILPEFATNVAGTLAFYPWAPAAVALVLARHVVMLGYTLWAEGMDAHHMSMARIDGRLGNWRVNQAYHAMHHVNPRGYFGSVNTLFDKLFGTAVSLSGKRVLVTGATGAFGREMLGLLVREGAKVDAARHGEDFGPGGLSAAMRWKLAAADIVVLAHGTRASGACWPANCWASEEIVMAAISAHRGRLVPVEVWGLGSEAEIFGRDEYAKSKRGFARAAAKYARSPDVIYRHIVPAAFASGMGGPGGLFSARFVAWAALALIKRGFRYIPVTWTGIAFLNWPRWALRKI